MKFCPPLPFSPLVAKKAYHPPHHALKLAPSVKHPSPPPALQGSPVSLPAPPLGPRPAVRPAAGPWSTPPPPPPDAPLRPPPLPGPPLYGSAEQRGTLGCLCLWEPRGWGRGARAFLQPQGVHATTPPPLERSTGVQGVSLLCRKPLPHLAVFPHPDGRPAAVPLLQPPSRRAALRPESPRRTGGGRRVAGV